MDKFEKLLSEISQGSQCEEGKECLQGKKEPALRRIVIAYEKGKEEDAKIILQSSEPNDDSYAILFAVGKMLGEHCGMDGKKIGKDLAIAAMKAMLKAAVGDIFNDLEELVNG